jgi:hypothetical protein
VKRIRTAAVVDVDGRAGGTAVLGAHVVGDDLELADRVRRGLHHLVREALVARAVGVVVDAIDQEVVEHAAEAVDVQGPLPGRVPGRQRRSAEFHSRRQQRERRILAGEQGQRARLIAGDHLAALAGVGLEQRRRGGDLDLLAHLPDGHLEVDAQPRADLDADVVDEREREARLLGGDDVGARLDGDELVRAAVAGSLHGGNAGLGAGQGDFGAGHDRARRITHGADHGRAVELRERPAGAEQQDTDGEQEADGNASGGHHGLRGYRSSTTAAQNACNNGETRPRITAAEHSLGSCHGIHGIHRI